MPIFEARCVNPACGRVFEYFSHRWTDQAPTCEACGAGSQKLEVSRFAVVWTGTIGGRYIGRSKEGACEDGHIAWRVRSSRSGKPEPVRIETWQQQREFCKQEGLYNPKDIPSCGEV